MTEPGCTRCGQCCSMAFINLSGVRKGEDNLEFAKWLTHHLMTVKWTIPDEGEEPTLMVRIPLVCKHLGYDKDGIAFCVIYEKRPVICRNYKCNKLKKLGGEQDADG